MGNIMSRNFIYNIYGFLAWMSLLLICYRLVNQLFVRAQKKWDKRRIQTQYRGLVFFPFLKVEENRALGNLS